MSGHTPMAEANHAAAAELARKYREADCDGARAGMILELAQGGGFTAECLEALLVQHMEMLAALESMVEEFEDKYDAVWIGPGQWSAAPDAPTDGWELARAAIAKARGEEVA